MIKKLLKLASFYDKMLQFEKANEIHQIIKRYAEKTEVIDEDPNLPFASTFHDEQIASTFLESGDVFDEEREDVNSEEWDEQAEQEGEYFGPGFKEFYKKWSSGVPMETCVSHLQKVGSGAFRTVYDLGEWVLKIAKTSQSDKFHPPKKMNKLEADYNMAQKFPEFTVKTYAHAKDFSWIVQDKVNIMKSPYWFLMFFPEVKGIPLPSNCNIREVFRSYIFIVAEKLGLDKEPRSNEFLGSDDKIKELNTPGFIKKRTDSIEELFKSLRTVQPSDLMERFVRFIYRFGIHAKDVRDHNVGYVEKDGKTQLVLPDISRNISKESSFQLIKKKADKYDKEFNFLLADKYTDLLKQAQLSSLEPEFQSKVSAVMSELKQLGWKPRVASGRRSIKSQIGKFQKGYSVIFGTGAHYLGLAADVIDSRYGWKVKGNHKFFQDLGRIAQKNGLTWGGKWKNVYPPYGDVAHIQAPGSMIGKFKRNKKIAVLQDSMEGLGIPVQRTGELDEQTNIAWNKLKNILLESSEGKISLPELSKKTAPMGSKYAQYLTMMKQVKLTRHTKKNLKRMSLMFGKDVRHLWKDQEMKEALRKNEKVYEIQELLKEKGFYKAKLDGAWGKKTSEAWQKFARKNPSPETDRMEREIKQIFA